MKPFSSTAIRRRNAAFTMVEIAMALAIIGFALVAIIGILPLGMDVQKKNRRETIINQDANLLIETLRGGSRGLDDLTNYVIGITNFWSYYDANHNISANGTDWYLLTNSFYNNRITGMDLALTNGARIIGLLGTPQIIGAGGNTFYSNYLTAYFRALSGAAVEKAPQSNEVIHDASFGYKLISEVVPYASQTNTDFDISQTNYLASDIAINTNAVQNQFTNWLAQGRGDPNPGFGWVLASNSPAIASNPDEVARRAHNWQVAPQLNRNLYDVRLVFRWPLLPGGRVSREGRQVYRFTVTAALTNDAPGTPFYYFQPQTYQHN